MAGLEAIRNIMVVGIGGIGGLMGARLAAGCAPAGGRGPAGGRSRSGGGRHLTFIARGPHLEAIRAAGLLLVSPDGTSARVRPDLATDRLEQAPGPDLVFVCVKGYDLAETADRLARVVREDTAIVPLLNGADIAARIRSRVERGAVLPACIYVSSRVREPGAVEHVGGAGMVHLGPDPARPGLGPGELPALLEGSGIPFRWYGDPAPAVWTKYVFIAAFGLVTAAHRADLGRVLAGEELVGQARAVMEEIVRLAAVRGVGLAADVVESSLRIAASFPPATRTSYQRDIEAGAARNEGDLFAGTILRMGGELGVPTPVTAELAAAIAASAPGGAAPAAPTGPAPLP